MKPQIKIGLIVGAVAALINLCVSTLFGICGPVTGLIAGGIAGFLAARGSEITTKRAGAQNGAVAGGIAGLFTTTGQILAGVISLLFVQFLDIPPIFGSVPPPSADPAQQIVYYGSGLGTGLCLGLVGLVLAALVGAGVGYLTASDPSAEPVTSFDSEGDF